MTPPSSSSAVPVNEGAAASVTPVTATALAVANMVGIGVFTSLGFQVKDLPSGFTLLMLWVVGGVIALCGALSYAELATMFPRSGGEYNFLSRIYHRALGFVAGWVSATVGFTAPTALAAMAFGGYFAGVVPGVPPLALALGLIWSIAFVHLRGVQRASTFQNVSTFIKVALIVAFIIAAFALGSPSSISFAPSVSDIGHIASPAFAVSLAFVMYSYAGWNAVTYIAGEVRDPRRTLPYSVIAAVVTVTLLYVGLNAVFLYSTPIEQLSGQIDVAVIAGHHIFGDTGGRIVGALICIGLVSTISAMMWVGPRVIMVMGEDFPLLSPFARRAPNGVPVRAVLFQLGVVTVLLLTQGFESILEFIQFSLTISSFLTVLGVIVLRFAQPDLPRPYRVWGYPLTPMVFLAVSLFMMINLVLERPTQSLAGVAMMLTGLLIYGLSLRYPRTRTRSV
ncbi:MAG: amino acid permease [Rhodospirillales bacterium]|nr:amino acid permease [Rhodospirillales bacterium]